MARDAGIDLWKLPFVDARPQRTAYLLENKGKVRVCCQSCASSDVMFGHEFEQGNSECCTCNILYTAVCVKICLERFGCVGGILGKSSSCAVAVVLMWSHEGKRDKI